MSYRNNSRYIPEHSLPIEEAGLGTVYVYPAAHRDGKTYYGARAYRPKAIKADWAYIFKSDAELDKKIAAWFDGIRQHKQTVANRRAKDFAGHDFKVGDIVTNSWGYDQTNVDWYVVNRTTKNYVWLKPICARLVSEESQGYSPMAGVESVLLDENLKPVEGDGPETKHRASGDYISMRHG